MIYVVIGFLAVLCAALGGILYAKGRDLGDTRNLVAALSRVVEAQDAAVKALRSEVADASAKTANIQALSEYSNRLLALERNKADASAPKVVRGINEARRMAANLGGVEKLG